MLKVNNIDSFYGNMQVIWDVSLEVKKGEVLSIIGVNGAGKTTLMKSLVGLVKKTGTVLFEGKDISNLPSHRMAELGISYVPEGRRIFPELTVEENLIIGSYNKRAKPDRLETLEYVLNLFPRLKERYSSMGGNLSGGEQQMLAIGRGLMAKPKLLLLDEPSLGIAPLIVDEIFKTINEIKDDVTIILVEQQVKHALNVADQAFVVEHGEITLSGTGEELRTNEYVKKAYLGI